MDRSKRAEVSSYPAEADRRTDGQADWQTDSSSTDLDLTVEHKMFFTKTVKLYHVSFIFSGFLTYTATVNDDLKREKYELLDLKTNN